MVELEVGDFCGIELAAVEHQLGAALAHRDIVDEPAQVDRELTRGELFVTADRGGFDRLHHLRGAASRRGSLGIACGALGLGRLDRIDLDLERRGNRDELLGIGDLARLGGLFLLLRERGGRGDSQRAECKAGGDRRRQQGATPARPCCAHAHETHSISPVRAGSSGA